MKNATETQKKKFKENENSTLESLSVKEIHKLNELKNILQREGYSNSDIDTLLKEKELELDGYLNLKGEYDAEVFAKYLITDNKNKKEINLNTNNNLSNDNASEKMAKKKTQLTGLANNINIATSMIKSKADYNKFPSVTKTLTVGDKKLSGKEAQNLFYSRKYSGFGRIISNGTEDQHSKAVAILKSYQKLSGPEQAAQAHDTLESIMKIYNKGRSGGGKKKLSVDEKVDFSNLF